MDGGYRVSGLGQLLQRLRQCAVAIPRRHDPAARRPAAAGIFLLRTADIAIDDNWRTMGLAGTGSKTIVADNAFVPVHRALAFAELADATAPGMRAHANPLYKQSFLAVLPIAIVAPVARHGGGRAGGVSRHGEGPHHARRAWPAAIAGWPS